MTAYNPISFVSGIFYEFYFVHDKLCYTKWSPGAYISLPSSVAVLGPQPIWIRQLGSHSGPQPVFTDHFQAFLDFSSTFYTFDNHMHSAPFYFGTFIPETIVLLS